MMRTNRMLRFVSVFLGAAVVFAGCNGLSGGPTVPTLPVVLQSNINSFNQVPSVGSLLIARLKVQISGVNAPIVVTISGLSPLYNGNSVTNVALHAGDFGETGPKIFTLYTAADGAFQTPFEKTLTVQEFQAAPDASINTFADAVRTIAQGHAYLEISTRARPDGEIRGQVGQDQLTALLAGSSEIQPPTNSAYLTDTVIFSDAARRRLSITMDSIGTQVLKDVIGAEIHFGDVLNEGHQAPVLFVLSPAVAGEFPRTFTKTLTAADFHPAPTKGINTLDDMLQTLPFQSRMEGDQFFINIRTKTHPNGEICGSIFQNSLGSGAISARRALSR